MMEQEFGSCNREITTHNWAFKPKSACENCQWPDRFLQTFPIRFKNTIKQRVRANRIWRLSAALSSFQHVLAELLTSCIWLCQIIQPKRTTDIISYNLATSSACHLNGCVTILSSLFRSFLIRYLFNYGPRLPLKLLGINCLKILLFLNIDWDHVFLHLNNFLIDQKEALVGPAGSS